MRSRLLLSAVLLTSASPSLAQERLEFLPLRPFNVDIALRQAFTPNDREIALQAGFTALRYGNFEIGATYQYFGQSSKDVKADVHSIYANPRWNNFVDILDFPSGKPINRMLRHILFGPLEDRAVPYIGLIGGAVVAGPGTRVPTYVYGADVGVRFPVGHSIALEFTLGYFIYGLDFEGSGSNERQLLFTTGFFF
ncbi:MAG TPA: hypothetical protein VJR03_13505 [Nitrospira sp.]|nr:hypothetical protein [Nitrospira sp.]